MTYSLSTSVIIDTIQSMAAFRILSAPESERTLLAPLLRPEVRGQLKIMVKNAFAETVLALLSCVESCSLDGETPVADPGLQDPADDSDMILECTLTPAGGGRDYAGAAVRRNLEQAVAMRAMSIWALAAGDSSLASACGDIASSSLGSLAASLAPVATPFLRG